MLDLNDVREFTSFFNNLTVEQRPVVRELPSDLETQDHEMVATPTPKNDHFC